MPQSRYATRVRKCAVCGEPAPRAGRMTCQDCNALIKRIGVNHRPHARGVAPPPPWVDPTRADRIALYALRASAGLPLFG